MKNIINIGLYNDLLQGKNEWKSNIDIVIAWIETLLFKSIGQNMFYDEFFSYITTQKLEFYIENKIETNELIQFIIKPEDDHAKIINRIKHFVIKIYNSSIGNNKFTNQSTKLSKKSKHKTLIDNYDSDNVTYNDSSVNDTLIESEEVIEMSDNISIDNKNNDISKKLIKIVKELIKNKRKIELILSGLSIDTQLYAKAYYYGALAVIYYNIPQNNKDKKELKDLTFDEFNTKLAEISFSNLLINSQDLMKFAKNNSKKYNKLKDNIINYVIKVYNSKGGISLHELAIKIHAEKSYDKNAVKQRSSSQRLLFKRMLNAKKLNDENTFNKVVLESWIDTFFYCATYVDMKEHIEEYKKNIFLNIDDHCDENIYISYLLEGDPFEVMNEEVRLRFKNLFATCNKCTYSLMLHELKLKGFSEWIDSNFKTEEEMLKEFEYIKDASIEYQLEVIQQHPHAIVFIKDVSPEMQLLAVKKDITSVIKISNPTIDVLHYCVEFIINNINNLEIDSYYKCTLEELVCNNKDEDLCDICNNRLIHVNGDTCYLKDFKLLF